MCSFLRNYRSFLACLALFVSHHSRGRNIFLCKLLYWKCYLTHLFFTIPFFYQFPVYLLTYPVGFLCSSALLITSDSVSCIRLHQGPSERLQRRRHHRPDLWGFCLIVAMDPRVSSPVGLRYTMPEIKKKKKLLVNLNRESNFISVVWVTVRFHCAV